MTRRDIRLAAENFLKHYHASLTIPVPIEEILEIKLDVEVRPLPGLYKLYARNGILLSSGKVIAVDNDDFESNQTRLRFTLAHELGHILLHKEHIDSVSLNDVAQAWEQYNGIEAELLGQMERDANYFAGHVLVPQAALTQELAKVQATMYKDHKLDITGKGSDVRDAVARVIEGAFDVSHKVVRARLEEENLP